MGMPTMVMAANVRPHACVELDIELLDVTTMLPADATAEMVESSKNLNNIGTEELRGLAEALSSVYSIMVRNGITGTAAASKDEIGHMRRSVESAMLDNGGKYEYVGHRGNVLCVLDVEKRKVHFRAKLMHNAASSDTLRDTIMFRSSADTMVYAMHVPIQSLKYATTEDYQPITEKVG